MTAGIIRQALGLYLARDRDFMGEYFPNVLTRGYPLYDDVFSIDQRQAEALVPMLETTVAHYRTLDGRERARNTHLIERTPIESGFESTAAKKFAIWLVALKDLCKLYDLPCPM